MPLATMNFPRESIKEQLSYPVSTIGFEDQSEQRILSSGKKITGFSIESPPLTKAQMKARRDFYTARKGEFEEFLFTSPFDDVQYTVKFSGNMSIEFKNGAYYCSYKLSIIDQDEE